jgi:predicted outer membrane repeat protein
VSRIVTAAGPCAEVPEVAVLGGFPSGGGDIDSRDPATNATILSGDIDGDDMLDAGNTYTVVKFPSNNEPVPAELDGFTVKWGNNLLDGAGGGIQVNQSRAKVKNCRIELNAAQQVGGGAAVLDTSTDELVEFFDCVFFQNTAPGHGGAVTMKGHGELRFVNCLLHDNDGGGDAGGVWVESGWPRFIDCTLRENECDGQGGAVHLSNSNTGTPNPPYTAFDGACNISSAGRRTARSGSSIC